MVAAKGEGEGVTGAACIENRGVKLAGGNKVSGLVVHDSSRGYRGVKSAAVKSIRVWWPVARKSAQRGVRCGEERRAILREQALSMRLSNYSLF